MSRRGVQQCSVAPSAFLMSKFDLTYRIWHHARVMPYPVSQIKLRHQKCRRCDRTLLHAAPTHAVSPRSLPRTGPCSTMAAIILHLLSL